MLVKATFELNVEGVGEYLKTNPALRDRLAETAQRGLAYAQSIAPVGDPDEGASGAYGPETGRRPGDYKRDLKASVVVGRTRMIARVEATDFKSWWIEYGSSHMPKYRVLGRTMDRLKVGGGEGSADAAIR